MSVEQRRRLVTAVPGPRSLALAARKAASVADGVGNVLGAYIVEAGGGVLVDADGNQLIDFGSGIAVTTVGNAAPAVVRRVRDAVERFTHTCFMVTPYEGYVEVAERLAELTPGDHAKKSALFNSGAEAVENAVKIARVATGRTAVVCFDHAYHGRTNLAMALTAKDMPYKHGFGPFATDVYRMPMPYPYRWAGDPSRVADEAYAQFESQVHVQVGETQVAAVIIEPIQGEGGFIVPPDGFLPRLAEWCREHGAVFVADEIQTGFCRTGDWFACDHEGVVPDLITTAKGIAGGLPLAAVTGQADLMDAVHPGGLGGTYGGNPIACAAALGAIEEMQTHDLPGRARQVERVFRTRLEALAGCHPQIGEVRGRGAMMAVELVEPGGTRPDAALTGRVARGCHARGLVVLTAGSYGNVLRFLPPLSISDDLLHEGLDLLGEAFAEATGRG